MGTVDDYLTPNPPAPDEAVRHKKMLDAWTGGAIRAKNAATWLQAIGDQLAKFAASIHGMRPMLPDTDAAEWHETNWPETGVDADDIRHHLLTAMAGMYAMAGGYRRAASELDRALRRQQADEANA